MILQVLWVFHSTSLFFFLSPFVGLSSEVAEAVRYSCCQPARSLGSWIEIRDHGGGCRGHWQGHCDVLWRCRLGLWSWAVAASLQGALLGGSWDIHPPHCSSLSAKGLLYQEGNRNGTVMKPWWMLLYWEGSTVYYCYLQYCTVFIHSSSQRP